MSVFVFPAILSREGDTIGAVFPDLPGCTSAASSEGEIAISAAEALSGHLEVMMDHGERIPEPSGLSDVTLDPSLGEYAAILVVGYAALPARAGHGPGQAAE